MKYILWSLAMLYVPMSFGAEHMPEEVRLVASDSSCPDSQVKKLIKGYDVVGATSYIRQMNEHETSFKHLGTIVALNRFIDHSLTACDRYDYIISRLNNFPIKRTSEKKNSCNAECTYCITIEKCIKDNDIERLILILQDRRCVGITHKEKQVILNHLNNSPIKGKRSELEALKNVCRLHVRKNMTQNARRQLCTPCMQEQSSTLSCLSDTMKCGANWLCCPFATICWCFDFIIGGHGCYDATQIQ